MILEWCRFAVAAACFVIGILFMVLAVFGVNRFDKALNRMHAAALGDTLGILFVFLGLILMRGWSMDSLKLFLVILFFWMASPVSGHMISRLEATTDESLGEIQVIRKGEEEREQVQEEQMQEEERKQTQEEERKQMQKEERESADRKGKMEGDAHENI